jgi:hypothetical protein
MKNLQQGLLYSQPMLHMLINTLYLVVVVPYHPSTLHCFYQL